MLTRERAQSVAAELGVETFVAHALEQTPARTIAIPIPTDVRNLVVVPAEGTADDIGRYRKRIGEAVAAVRSLAVADAVWCLNEMAAPAAKPGVPADGYWKTRHALGALSADLYRYDEHKSKPASDQHVDRVAVLAEPGRSHRRPAGRAARQRPRPGHGDSRATLPTSPPTCARPPTSRAPRAGWGG